MDERAMFEQWAKSTFGFWIDDDPPRVLSYVDGGCHPASTEEIAMWDTLQAARRTTPDSEFEFTDGVSSHTVHGDKKTIDALLRWKMNQQRITENALKECVSRTTPDREAIVRAGEDVVITNVPNRIYLNLGDICEMGELPFQQLTDVTWCEDRIDGTDIEYVRVAAPTSDKGGA